VRLHLITCVGVEDDLAYLPHFLAHYRGLGIPPGDIHVLAQAPRADHPGLEAADRILTENGVAPSCRWVAPYTSRSMWEQRRTLQKARVAASDYVLSADVDEFHEYPVPPMEVARWCRDVGYDVVQGPFIDRLSASGRLDPLPPADRSIFDAFPVETELRHTLAGLTEDINLGGSVKLMLIRGDVEPGLGGHGALGKHRDRPHALGIHLSRFRELQDPKARFALPFLVHHFKWTAGVAERMRRRLHTPGISQAGRAYAERLLAFFDSGRGLDPSVLATRDPARDAPADWKKSVAAWRRRARVQQVREGWWSVKDRVRSMARA
jgi:hypothetical protein